MLWWIYLELITDHDHEKQDRPSQQGFCVFKRPSYTFFLLHTIVGPHWFQYNMYSIAYHCATTSGTALTIAFESSSTAFIHDRVVWQEDSCVMNITGRIVWHWVWHFAKRRDSRKVELVWTCATNFFFLFLDPSCSEIRCSRNARGYHWKWMGNAAFPPPWWSLLKMCPLYMSSFVMKYKF